MGHWPRGTVSLCGEGETAHSRGRWPDCEERWTTQRRSPGCHFLARWEALQQHGGTGSPCPPWSHTFPGCPRPGRGRQKGVGVELRSCCTLPADTPAAGLGTAGPSSCMPPAGIVRCGEGSRCPRWAWGGIATWLRVLPDTHGDRTVWKGHHRRSEVSGNVTGCATGCVGDSHRLPLHGHREVNQGPKFRCRLFTAEPAISVLFVTNPRGLGDFMLPCHRPGFRAQRQAWLCTWLAQDLLVSAETQVRASLCRPR